jgi:hypothetical protein
MTYVVSFVPPPTQEELLARYPEFNLKYNDLQTILLHIAYKLSSLKNSLHDERCIRSVNIDEVNESLSHISNEVDDIKQFLNIEE